MFSKISNYITDQIYFTVPGVEPEKREIIEYGAYMTLPEILKISIILIIASTLNVFLYVLGIITIFGFLRMTLGGVHAKTHWGCMISYLSIVYGILAASLLLNVNFIYIDIAVIPFSLIVSYLYAPADMPVKPVVSKKQRKKLRIMGFSLLTILFIVAHLADPVWFNIIMFTCVVENTLMTPIVYKITKNKYGKEVSA